ncbi:PAS domain-containing protein [Thalassobaculum salexigens]|uniref:PAS domain-containing protein n=1 Tax=Thalassobaculum salexigens TaxID=455360 RepID=UPI0003F4AF29|nr:PAS domain-containing protein [Thalassobaculum salexigens]
MQADDDPVLASAIAFWTEHRPVGGLPTRREIDPLRIPPHLFPYLILAEVMTPQGRVRYRVVGDEMVHRWGTNFVGRRSDEIFSGDYRAYLEGAFALAIRHWQPVFTASRFRWDVGGFLWTRRVMLPIGATDQGPVTQVLVVQTWPNSREDRRTDPMVIVPGTAPVENAKAVLVTT